MDQAAWTPYGTTDALCDTGTTGCNGHTEARDVRHRGPLTERATATYRGLSCTDAVWHNRRRMPHRHHWVQRAHGAPRRAAQGPAYCPARRGTPHSAEFRTSLLLVSTGFRVLQKPFSEWKVEAMYGRAAPPLLFFLSPGHPPPSSPCTSLLLACSAASPARAHRGPRR